MYFWNYSSEKALLQKFTKTMAVVHNNRMQTDFGKRYALTSADDAGVMWQM